MGGSYGGFMAMWANTQTDRFKAIVAGAGLSNWVSYYGTNGINTWMLPFFGKPLYDDSDAYRRVSAVNYVKNAKIGRAHVCTPVTNAHLVCRLLLEKKKNNEHTTLTPS